MPSKILQISAIVVFALNGFVLCQWDASSLPGTIKIMRVTKTNLRNGEAPHWQQNGGILYFVDIPNSTIQKYVPATNTYTWAKVGNEEVSIIIPAENQPNRFVISYGCSIATVTWDGFSTEISDLRIIATVDQYPEIRLNDGKVSPAGVLFAGTQLSDIKIADNQPSRGHLYAIHCENRKFRTDRASIKTLLSDVKISNGFAWSFDQKYFYYIDSLAYRIDRYNYNPWTTKLANRQTVFDLHENKFDGFLDGMTIDTEDNLWVTVNNAGYVLQINPRNGSLLNSIRLPVMNVSSLTFGGPQLDELFVTSGSDKLPEYFFKQYPLSGCLFKITGTGSRGFPGRGIILQT